MRLLISANTRPASGAMTNERLESGDTEVSPPASVSRLSVDVLQSADKLDPEKDNWIRIMFKYLDNFELSNN